MYFSYKKKSKKKANLEAKEDQRKEGSHIMAKICLNSNLNFHNLMISCGTFKTFRKASFVILDLVNI